MASEQTEPSGPHPRPQNGRKLTSSREHTPMPIQQSPGGGQLATSSSLTTGNLINHQRFSPNRQQREGSQP
jgi:hypothetical protein